MESSCHRQCHVRFVSWKQATSLSQVAIRYLYVASTLILYQLSDKTSSVKPDLKIPVLVFWLSFVQHPKENLIIHQMLWKNINDTMTIISSASRNSAKVADQRENLGPAFLGVRKPSLDACKLTRFFFKLPTCINHSPTRFSHCDRWITMGNQPLFIRYLSDWSIHGWWS